MEEVSSEKLIVMVNGMGATPLSELNIAAKYVAENFQEKHIDVVHWFVGDYMTALDMQGLSLTLVPYTEEVLTALTESTASPYFN
ncbi:MAG: dihydroxyacetone kinase subunit DhaK, partial [Staphylococcus equorum]|nr:dihydroxyacetone kinase subunit DhaK [Staphylococcus equorum]